MGGSSVIIGILISVVVTVGLFLVLREAMCWYWKINEILSVLKSIDSKLNPGKRAAPGGGDVLSQGSIGDKEMSRDATVWTCSCGTENSLEEKRCRKCFLHRGAG